MRVHRAARGTIRYPLSSAAPPTMASLDAPHPPFADELEESFEGRVIADKYLVEHAIGAGGMGTVWRGKHLLLGTRVAIKFIRRSFAERPDARRRFEIEARAAASVGSIHAAAVYDYGVTSDGLPYIVMEHLEGEALSDALVRRGPFPAREAAKVIEQAARALTKAHAAGVVHRDLKPDNIFLARSDERPDPELPYLVKLVDFGIAKLLDGAAAGGQYGGPTQDGSVIGTPNFMSPEQLTLGGTPGPAADLWALGACAFTALTARIPFEGDALGDIVLRVCVAPLPVPSAIRRDVPPGFDAWFARACNRAAAKRFTTADELARTFADVCGVGSVPVATLSEDRIQYVMRAPASAGAIDLPDDLPTGAMSPKTALLAGIVVGVSLMVGLLGLLAWRMKDAEEQAQDRATEVVDAGAASGSR